MMLPALFISHGSPMLALQPGASGPALARLAAELPRPTAILVLSAHWESRELSVSGASQPETWHDFYGFPEALYALRYDPPGAPELAERVARLTGAAHDPHRGLDHGAYVPLVAMLSADAISMAGNAAALVAIPWYVLLTTGSASKTGITAAAGIVPVIISGLVGGPYVDRLGYRRASIIARCAPDE